MEESSTFQVSTLVTRYAIMTVKKRWGHKSRFRGEYDKFSLEHVDFDILMGQLRYIWTYESKCWGGDILWAENVHLGDTSIQAAIQTIKGYMG